MLLEKKWRIDVFERKADSLSPIIGWVTYDTSRTPAEKRYSIKTVLLAHPDTIIGRINKACRRECGGSFLIGKFDYLL